MKTIKQVLNKNGLKRASVYINKSRVIDSVVIFKSGYTRGVSKSGAITLNLYNITWNKWQNIVDDFKANNIQLPNINMIQDNDFTKLNKGV